MLAGGSSYATEIIELLFALLLDIVRERRPETEPVNGGWNVYQCWSKGLWHHPPCSLSATAGSTVFSSFRMDISTAISTTEPPRIVAILGTSVNTMNARTGASGVSRALNRAVCPEGTRFAPSANVTEATENSNPNAAKTKISNGSYETAHPSE